MNAIKKEGFWLKAWRTYLTAIISAIAGAMLMAFLHMGNFAVQSVTFQSRQNAFDSTLIKKLDTTNSLLTEFIETNKQEKGAIYDQIEANRQSIKTTDKAVADVVSTIHSINNTIAIYLSQPNKLGNKTFIRCNDE